MNHVFKNMVVAGGVIMISGLVMLIFTACFGQIPNTSQYALNIAFQVGGWLFFSGYIIGLFGYCLSIKFSYSEFISNN